MLLHQYVNSRVSSTEHYPSIVLVFIVKPLHNSHLGDKRKWPLWRGGRYGEVGVFCDQLGLFLSVAENTGRC